MMANRLIILASAALALASAGCSSMSEETAKPNVSVASGVKEDKDRVERSQSVKVTAVVENVDLANRRVTLRGPEGKVQTVTVDETVRNLPQVHKGDTVS